MTTEVEGDNEEQVARCIAMLRSAKYVVMCCLDSDDEMTVIRKGIPEEMLPAALRHFADSLAGVIAEQMVKQAVEAVPDSHKGRCPSCAEQVVMLPTDDGENIRMVKGRRARAVCTCGAFLLPTVLDDGGLGLRLMTMEEIAALTDEQRNQMLSVRRRYAGYQAKLKARREQAN